MSYPNKENRVDNHHPEGIESSQKQGEKKKSSLKELDKEQPSRLPVGQLKWSKDEEEEQDTRANLGVKVDRKPELDDEPVEKEELSATGQKPGEKEESESAVPFASFDVDHAKEQPDRDQRDPDEDGKQQEQPQRQRTLSLEDTLTPIDFKEYSIDPEQETGGDSEYQTEYKKPSYVVRQDDEDGGFGSDEADSHGISDRKQIITKRAIKILWLPMLLVVVLITGLIIGHTVIGDQPAGDIFDLDMWEHIYKLIYG